MKEELIKYLEWCKKNNKKVEDSYEEYLNETKEPKVKKVKLSDVLSKELLDMELFSTNLEQDKKVINKVIKDYIVDYNEKVNFGYLIYGLLCSE